LECKHIAQCADEQAAAAVAEAAADAERIHDAARLATKAALAEGASARDAELAALSVPGRAELDVVPEVMCAVCGEEPADSECQECGDKYCSSTWMGNDGCFASMHNKGARKRHKLVPLTVED
jgi:hypothetical protein